MKYLLLSVLFIFGLAATSTCWADDSVEDRLAQLENKVVQLETKLEGCRVEPRFYGRFGGGYCPQGTYVNEIDITQNGHFINIWVSCFYPKLVCPEPEND